MVRARLGARDAEGAWTVICFRENRRAALRRAVVVLAALCLALPVVTAFAPSPAAAAPAISSAEQGFLRLLNQERVARGLPALVFDEALAATARSWSSHMRSTGVLAHNTEAGVTADIEKVEPNWRAWGENVGQGYSVPTMHSMFMGSDVHRRNILKANFNRVGIGVVTSGSRLWVTVRFLQGPAVSGPTGLSCRERPIVSVVAADLNDDGRDDITVNRDDRSCDWVYLGQSTGRFRAQSVSIGGSYIPVPGNFDGKGGDNVLWYAPGPAQDYLSKWSGTGFNSIPQTINGHYRPYSGDFDGDGRDDILWYAPGTGQDYIWYGTSTFGRVDSRPLTVNGIYDVVVTDLDGDGRDDILWYGPGTAPDYVHYSTGRGRYSSVAVTINGRYQPVAGDFDGDKRGDIIWYAPGAAQDYVWYGHGRRGSYDSRPITINGIYRPVSGDFNGDRRDDIVWIGSDPVGSPMWLGRSARGAFVDSRFRV